MTYPAELVEALLAELQSKDARAVVESSSWHEAESGLKAFLDRLEPERPGTFALLAGEYTNLSNALCAAAFDSQPPSREKLVYLARRLLSTLRALNPRGLDSFQREIELRKADAAKDQSTDDRSTGKKMRVRRQKIVLYDIKDPHAEFYKKPWYYKGIRRSQIGLALALEKEQGIAAHARLCELLPSPPSKIYDDLKRSNRKDGIAWWTKWITKRDNIYSLKGFGTGSESSRNKYVKTP